MADRNQDDRQTEATERLAESFEALPERLAAVLEDFDRWSDVPRLALPDDALDSGSLALAFSEAWVDQSDELLAQVTEGFDSGFERLAAAFDGVESALAALDPPALDALPLGAVEALAEAADLPPGLMDVPTLEAAEMQDVAALDPAAWEGADMPLAAEVGGEGPLASLSPAWDWEALPDLEPLSHPHADLEPPALADAHEWEQADAAVPHASSDTLDSPDADVPADDSLDTIDGARGMFGAGDDDFDRTGGSGLASAMDNLASKMDAMGGELAGLKDALKANKGTAGPGQSAPAAEAAERSAPTGAPAPSRMPAGSRGAGTPDIDFARILGNIHKLR